MSQETCRLQEALIQLIQCYIQRQHIPMQVMAELRPQILHHSDAERGTIHHTERATTNHLPEFGDWGQKNEWRYCFHGRGCRLTHKTTYERIDWDAPDLDVIDQHWFVEWLEWRITQDKLSPAAETVRYIFSNQSQGIMLRELVFPQFEKLQSRGILDKLHPKRWNKFRFVNSKD